MYNNDLSDLQTSNNNSINSLSVSGKTITYTKNDNTTGTITTQDTTYNTATTSSNGLMSSNDKSKLEDLDKNNWTTSGSSGYVKTLGSNYVMSASDFTTGCGIYAISSLSTSDTNNYPSIGNNGDYYVINIYGGSSSYTTLIGISPRSDSLYVGHFWDSTWQGWHTIPKFTLSGTTLTISG